MRARVIATKISILTRRLTRPLSQTVVQTPIISKVSRLKYGLGNMALKSGITFAWIWRNVFGYILLDLRN